MSSPKKNKPKPIQRLLNRFTKRNRPSRALKKKIANLESQAKDLHKELVTANTAATELATRAEVTGRPATPVERSAPFIRPENAPPSDYEKQRLNYNKLVDEHKAMKGQFTSLQRRVPFFRGEVEEVKGKHVVKEGGKWGKVEQDIQALDDASLTNTNLLGELEGKVGVAGEKL